MILAIITAWLAYKRAKETGRNGWLWALIGALVFIGTQLTVGLGIGVFLGLGIEVMDWPESVLDDYGWAGNLIAIAASCLASWLLLRYLGKRPPIDSFTPPPPPPSFGENL